MPNAAGAPKASPERNAGSGRTLVPREKLRDKLVEELSIGHTSTASVLLSSDPWEFVDDRIIITVVNSFALNQLQKDKAFLSELVSSLLGQATQLEFKIRAAVQDNQPQEEKSEQVDILCRVFKGTVLEDRR